MFEDMKVLLSVRKFSETWTLDCGLDICTQACMRQLLDALRILAMTLSIVMLHSDLNFCMSLTAMTVLVVIAKLDS